MTVPLLDIHAQHASIREELDSAIDDVLAHGRFVGGPEVQAFEQGFARYCDSADCVGVSSGTDALTLALRAADVGPGDEVITTPFTFIATVESITAVGAQPVLVDPELDSALLRPEDAEGAISERTAAIVPVHLYGQPVDLEGFLRLARSRGLLLIEDAAQAHGATRDGIRVGSGGDAAAFSFFPGKNLGALGDAGCVTTSNPEIAARIRSLRDHGRGEKYRHDELGTNARLDTLQAAVLAVKLRHLDRWNEARRRHAAAYDAALEELDGVEPIAVADDVTHAYHQYVVRVADRDLALEHLKSRGVSAGVHYPIPLHRQPALAALPAPHPLPNAEALAREVLSLPVYPELTDKQRELVTEAMRSYAAALRGQLAEASQ